MTMYAETQVIIMEGRRPAAQELLDWSGRFTHVLRAQPCASSDCDELVTVWRNRLVDWFLRNTDLPWLISVDGTCVPVPETDAITGDYLPAVTGCRVIGKCGREVHAADGEIALSCWRASRVAMAEIGAPWFAVVPTPDGLALDQCACSYFSNRCRRGGYNPVHVGAIAHEVTCLASPGGSTGVRLAFPQSAPSPGCGNPQSAIRNPQSPIDAPLGQKGANA